MTEHSTIIDSIRLLLRDGATPSRLIDFVIGKIGPGLTYADLCSFFQEAFFLPIVRLSPSSMLSVRDHRGTVLNSTLLADIVQRKLDWWIEHNSIPTDAASWMDNITVYSVEQLQERARAYPFPVLSSASWTTLTTDEQDALYTLLVSGQILSQRVEVLAHLAERLQSIINSMTSSKDATGH